MTRKIAAVLAVLMGGQPRGLQCNVGKKLCGICSIRDRDCADHVLFRCSEMVDIREKKWTQVVNSMPPGMAACVEAMVNDNEKTKFVLSGLRCDYLIEEWGLILVNISEFVYAMYKNRKLIYDATLNS